MRKLEVMNDACLAKLIGKLNRGEGGLWGQVLQGKYGGRRDGNGQLRASSGSRLLF